PPAWTNHDGDTSFDSGTIGATGKETGWAELIQPYVKSRQLFQCPSEPNRPASATSNSTGYTDYIYNGDIGSYVSGGARLAAIIFPSQTVLVNDWESTTAGYAMITNHSWYSVITEDKGQ